MATATLGCTDEDDTVGICLDTEDWLVFQWHHCHKLGFSTQIALLKS